MAEKDSPELTLADIAVFTGGGLGCALGIYLSARNVDLGLYVPWISAISLVITVVGFALVFEKRWAVRRPWVSKVASWVRPCFGLVLGITLGAGFALCANYEVRMVNWVLDRLPGKYLNWLALAVVPIGYGAYRFKKANQSLYGTAEVLVGLATALGATTKGPFGAAQGLAIIGATYVVARGFNNASDGRAREEDLEASHATKAPSTEPQSS